MARKLRRDRNDEYANDLLGAKFVASNVTHRNIPSRRATNDRARTRESVSSVTGTEAGRRISVSILHRSSRRRRRRDIHFFVTRARTNGERHDGAEQGRGGGREKNRHSAKLSCEGTREYRTEESYLFERTFALPRDDARPVSANFKRESHEGVKREARAFDFTNELNAGR